MGVDKAVEVEDENEGPSVVPEEYFMGYKIEKLDQEKVDARIGYMAINLHDPPTHAVWGLHNDRKINDAWVKRLLQGFKTRYNNCSEKTCIEVVVRPEWLKNLDDVKMVIEGRGIKNVPLMEFTEEGEKAMAKEKLIMLGGNHRREAMRLYVTWLEEELESGTGLLEKRRAALGSTMVGEGVREVEKLEEKVEKCKELLGGARLWAVQLYDRGERIFID
jgi:hypothetical protein